MGVMIRWSILRSLRKSQRGGEERERYMMTSDSFFHSCGCGLGARPGQGVQVQMDGILSFSNINTRSLSPIFQFYLGVWVERISYELCGQFTLSRLFSSKVSYLLPSPLSILRGTGPG